MAEQRNQKAKTRSRKTPRGKAKRPKLSYTIKPDDMTLEQWQIALRQQVAIEENMGCRPMDNMPGEYIVSNPSSRREYKVVYRGHNSPWNYCSCMDFKTSGLGTCKHLEKVKLAIRNGNKGIRVHREEPPYTSVYLSYRGERQVKVRIGAEHHDEYTALAIRYFDQQGVMTPYGYEHYTDFFVEANHIDPSFRFYKDAIDFIIEKREAALRKRLLTKYTDEQLNALLTVPLYPYQREGVRFAFEKGRAAIADEMGLGKTIQAIAVAEMLRREELAESILIICPTSLKYQWKREIERFAKAKVLVIEGTHLKRKEQYADSEHPYKIVSYHSACNDIKLLGTLMTDMLIMDEVQRLKNWKTQISTAARRINSRYTVVLSGTPLENRLEELFSVMQFVDQYCLGPYYKFRSNHIMTDDTEKVIGYKNLNSVGDAVREHLIRRTKKQVELQMPKRQDKNLFVPMTDVQMSMHDEFKSTVAKLLMKWRRLHFLSESDRNRLLLCLSQMRMVCDSTYILDQKSRDDTKVDEVMSLLDGILDGNEDEKVVIFSQWERMTRLIAQQLDRAGIGYEYLHGGVPSAKRKDLIDNFNDDPASRVFLSTDAGSTGLNLQVASTVINMDLPWNPAVLEQRIARIYRLGQQRNVQVINLVAIGTIEERMLDKLRFKSAMFEGVLDNGEDTIYVGDNSGFNQMLDNLCDMVDDEIKESTPPVTQVEEPAEPGQTSASNEIPPELCDEEPTEDIVPTQLPVLTSQMPAREVADPSDIVRQGVSFFSSLAQTLSSPEATRQLVDSLVETDKQTGQTTLRIPVPNKETVQNVLSALSKLFE